MAQYRDPLKHNMYVNWRDWRTLRKPGLITPLLVQHSNWWQVLTVSRAQSRNGITNIVFCATYSYVFHIRADRYLRYTLRDSLRTDILYMSSIYSLWDVCTVARTCTWLVLQQIYGKYRPPPPKTDKCRICEYVPVRNTGKYVCKIRIHVRTLWHQLKWHWITQQWIKFSTLTTGRGGGGGGDTEVAARQVSHH